LSELKWNWGRVGEEFCFEIFIITWGSELMQCGHKLFSTTSLNVTSNTLLINVLPATLAINMEIGLYK